MSTISEKNQIKLRWVCPDGKDFETKEEAEQHSIDIALREVLYEHVIYDYKITDIIESLKKVFSISFKEEEEFQDNHWPDLTPAKPDCTEEDKEVLAFVDTHVNKFNKEEQ